MSSTTASTVKQRHYAALASQLRRLKTNLAESEKQMNEMSEQLLGMQRLGVNHAAQFMAVSRLLDEELKGVRESIEAQAEAAEAQSPAGHSDTTHKVM